MPVEMNVIPIRSSKIDASSTSIPTTYSTASGSKIITSVAFASHMMVINETAGRVAINVGTDDASSAPSSGDGEVYASANGTSAFDDIGVHSVVYMRSDSGSTISSGVVTVMVW